MRLAYVVLVLAASYGISRSQDYSEMQKGRRQAKAAFEREMAREKAGDCRDATTTYADNMCLEKESKTSAANYAEFSAAVRALLGAASPAQKEFDLAQAAWQKYRDLQCSAAFDLYKGGTIAPSAEGRCDLMLMRSHMRELEAVYHGTLNY